MLEQEQAHQRPPKAERLAALAGLRRQSRWPGYGNLADYHNGLYECDHVSPYTKSAGNVEADILVFLQDWSSHDRLSGPPDHEVARLGYTPGLPTNVNLAQLLRRHFQVAFADIFVTNLFPFIKTGNLSSGIPAKDMRRAALEFGLPQIEIIEPKLVICLGTATFNAIGHACDREPAGRLEQAISTPFTWKGSQVWCQSHPGILGRNNRNRGGVNRVDPDWARMAEAFRLVSHTGRDRRPFPAAS